MRRRPGRFAAAAAALLLLAASKCATPSAAPAVATTPPPEKSYSIFGNQVAVSYFTVSSPWNQYFTKMEDMFLSYASVLRWSPDLCHANWEIPNNRKSVIVSLPHIRCVSYYQCETIHEMMKTIGRSTVAKDTANNEMKFVLQTFHEMVTSELSFLGDGVLSSPELYVRYIEYNSFSARIAAAGKIAQAAKRLDDPALTRCFVAPTIVQFGKEVEEQVKYIKSLIKSIDRAARADPALWGASQTGNEGDDLIAIDGNKKFEVLDNRKEAVQLVKKRNDDLKNALKAVATPDGDKSVLDDRLPKTMSLSTLVPAFARVEMKVDNVASGKPTFFKVADLTAAAAEEDRFWKARQQQVRTELEKHGNSAAGFSVLFSRLPDSVQAEAVQARVSIELELSATAYCAHGAIHKFVYGYTLRGLDDQGDFPFWTESMQSAAAVDSARLVSDLIMSVRQAQGKSVRGIWNGYTTGGCVLERALERFDKGAKAEDLCITFHSSFDANDPTMQAWPVCAGLYPPKTMVMGKDTVRSAEDAVREVEEEIAKLREEAGPKLEQHRLAREAEEKERINKLNQERLAAWQAAAAAPAPSAVMSAAGGKSRVSNSAPRPQKRRRKRKQRKTPPPVVPPAALHPSSSVVHSAGGVIGGGGANGLAALPVLLELQQPRPMVIGELQSYQQRLRKGSNRRAQRRKKKKRTAAKLKSTVRQEAFQLSNVEASNMKPHNSRRSSKSSRKAVAVPQVPMPEPLRPQSIKALSMGQVPELRDRMAQLLRILEERKRHLAAASAFVGTICSTAAKQGVHLTWTVPLEIPSQMAQKCKNDMFNDVVPGEFKRLKDAAGIYDWDVGVYNAPIKTRLVDEKEYGVQF